MTNLRERQRELARRAIIDATAQLVTERRHLDFSMKEIAERAGVSLRTVYNHFPDRVDLLNALGHTFNQQMAARGGPAADDLGSALDLPTAIRSSMRQFEELGGISEAFAQMPLADLGRNDERIERTRRIAGHIAGLMPSIPHETADAIGLLCRHVLSHRSWFWLTHEYGIDTDEVADLVVWAVTALIDAANSGDLPDLTDPTQRTPYPTE